MKKMSMILITMLFAKQVMALDCPASIKVSVKGLSTVSAENDKAVEKIVDLGEHQTDKEYIQAVLASVNPIGSLNDTLTRVNTQTEKDICHYKGKLSDLTLVPKNYNNPVAYANLRIGEVKYVGSSPTKAWGRQATLKTPLTNFDQTTVETYRNRKSLLEMELLVQIPMGDYGTDGFYNSAKIGAAESVTYRVQ